MKGSWTNNLELLANKLFPGLENFRREEPFSCYRQLRPYFSDYIKLFERSKVHKSQEISWDYLNQGNLVCKNTVERISSYTQSIFYALDDSPSLMIAYLKRSKLLNETGHVKESEIDSGMAFQCFINNITKSPNEIVFMSKEPEVEVMGKIVRETVREMNVPKNEISYVESEIMSLLKRHLVPSSLGVVSKNDEFSLPALKDGENVNFPSSSNILRVEYSEAKGRHVIANRDIEKGDVLFVEKPFSFVVHKPFCSYCCQSRYTYIPCIHCRDVQYCSKVCRDEDWASCHKYECGFFDLLKQTGIGHLALKTLLRAESDINKLKSLSEKLKARETFSNTVFSELKYENVHNLLTHSESIGTKDFLQYSLTALLLSYYLIHRTNYAAETEENASFCAAIILRHIIQFVTNAHAITAAGTDVEGTCATLGEEEEQIGSGIYPSVSIMNHSCFPSVFITFNQSYIIVKAGKDIKMGEEVFNSYGVDCRKMKRRDRQEILRAQYFFDCNCEPCCETFDRYDILNSFKCGKCMGPLVKESEIPASTYVSRRRICLFCSQYHTLPEAIPSLEYYINGILTIGEASLKENNVPEALTIFLKGWKLSREFLFAYHRYISLLVKKIALCFFRLDYLRRCMKVLSYNITCVEGRFGLFSSELAIEAKIFSDVIKKYSRSVRKTKSVSVPDVLTDKEKEYVQVCEAMLKLLYGVDHPFVRDAIQNNPIPENTGDFSASPAPATSSVTEVSAFPAEGPNQAPYPVFSDLKTSRDLNIPNLYFINF